MQRAVRRVEIRRSGGEEWKFRGNWWICDCGYDTILRRRRRRPFTTRLSRISIGLYITNTFHGSTRLDYPSTPRRSNFSYLKSTLSERMQAYHMIRGLPELVSIPPAEAVPSRSVAVPEAEVTSPHSDTETLVGLRPGEQKLSTFRNYPTPRDEKEFNRFMYDGLLLPVLFRLICFFLTVLAYLLT